MWWRRTFIVDKRESTARGRAQSRVDTTLSHVRSGKKGNQVQKPRGQRVKKGGEQGTKRAKLYRERASGGAQSLAREFWVDMPVICCNR